MVEIVITSFEYNLLNYIQIQTQCSPFFLNFYIMRYFYIFKQHLAFVFIVEIVSSKYVLQGTLFIIT